MNEPLSWLGHPGLAAGYLPVCTAFCLSLCHASTHCQSSHRACLHFGCSQNNLLQAGAQQEQQLNLPTCNPLVTVVYTGCVTAVERSSRVKEKQRDPAAPRLLHRALSLLIEEGSVSSVSPQLWLHLSTYISILAPSRRTKD